MNFLHAIRNRSDNLDAVDCVFPVFLFAAKGIMERLFLSVPAR